MESEDDDQDCESHKEEASQCASADFVRDHEELDVPAHRVDAFGGCLSPFHHSMVEQHRTRTLDFFKMLRHQRM